MADVMYAIVSGEYSDYQVHCVCPTKEDAEDIVARANVDKSPYYAYRVEEMPVCDRSIQQVVTLQLQTTIWDNGEETDTRENTYIEWPFDTMYGAPVIRWRWVRAPMHHGEGGWLEVMGTDHERVRKVYGELRARLQHDDAFRMEREIDG